MNTLLDWLEILINRRKPTYGAVVKALTETECKLESAQRVIASVIDLADEWEMEMAMVSRMGDEWVSELREALKAVTR
jgi:hypothetical protein